MACCMTWIQGLSDSKGSPSLPLFSGPLSHSTVPLMYRCGFPGKASPPDRSEMDNSSNTWGCRPYSKLHEQLTWMLKHIDPNKNLWKRRHNLSFHVNVWWCIWSLVLRCGKGFVSYPPISWKKQITNITQHCGGWRWKSSQTNTKAHSPTIIYQRNMLLVLFHLDLGLIS